METIVNLKTHLSLDDMLQGNYENTHLSCVDKLDNVIKDVY